MIIKSVSHRYLENGVIYFQWSIIIAILQPLIQYTVFVSAIPTLSSNYSSCVSEWFESSKLTTQYDHLICNGYPSTHCYIYPPSYDQIKTYDWWLRLSINYWAIRLVPQWPHQVGSSSHCCLQSGKTSLPHKIASIILTGATTLPKSLFKLQDHYPSSYLTP